jgi:hypothetical protein
MILSLMSNLLPCEKKKEYAEKEFTLLFISRVAFTANLIAAKSLGNIPGMCGCFMPRLWVRCCRDEIPPLFTESHLPWPGGGQAERNRDDSPFRDHVTAGIRECDLEHE